MDRAIFLGAQVPKYEVLGSSISAIGIIVVLGRYLYVRYLDMKYSDFPYPES